ncbi:MAG: lipoprotein [Abyssibacter sp.]|uniref:LPS translocon maturation chaperone LptM n=1 Tax=Abyssibacter sp. TaxID=2320200 RepID=UPI003219E209
MRHRSRTTQAMPLFLLGILMIAGCGQMGPLTRPSEPARTTQPAPEMDHQQPPAADGAALPDAPPPDP